MHRNRHSKRTPNPRKPPLKSKRAPKQTTAHIVRFLVLSTLGITVPTIILEVVNPYHFLFTYQLAISRFQIWRVVTSFFLVPSPGQKLQIIFDVAMLYRSSNQLEQHKYPRRSADYAWHILIAAASCLALNIPLRSTVHFRPLLYALTTVSSLIDPEARTSFYGLITFAQKWYPLMLLGLDTLNYGTSGAAVAATGLITGYAWWMLEWKETPGSPPPGSGRIMGRAPNWLQQLIGDQTRDEVPAPAGGVHVQAPLGRSLNDGGRETRPATTSGGYNWGRGQRLGSS